MNVCMLASSYPRFEGDIAGTFVRSLAIALVQLGHEVHVVMPDDGNPIGRQDTGGVVEHRFRYAPNQRLRVLGYARALEGDRRLRRIAHAMIVPFALAGALRLGAVARRSRAEIIHAHWLLPSGPIAMGVAQATHRPLVISLHGSDVYLAEKQQLYRPVAAWALSRAARVTACSGDLRERSLGLGARVDRTDVIPYGVSPEFFTGRASAGQQLRQSLGFDADDPIVLCLGRLVYKKGFEHLIEAFPRVLAKYPRAKLVIAGDGYLAGEFYERIKRLQIDRSVKMPGQVSWKAVGTYLSMCDVFVVPSVTDATGNVDGLPNVALEAMASGKPVVATRVGGLPDVIVDEETGLLIEQKSPAAIFQAIDRLLGDPAVGQRLGQNAREFVVERLSWAAVAQRFVSTFEDALEAPARH